MSNKFEERNIFDDINKGIIKDCKSNDDIYEKVPFVGENIEDHIVYCTSMGWSPLVSGISSIGSIISSGAPVGIKNIFNTINKKSKNISKISVANGEWEQNLKVKNIDELIDIINFNNFSIQLYLNNIKQYSNLTWDNIAERSNYKKKYLEGIFTIGNKKSKRNPSRDCIIGLSFAFNLNMIETNYLLKAAGYNELYLRNRKDLIIAKSIMDRKDIKYLNKYLIKHGEDKIGNLDDEEYYSI